MSFPQEVLLAPTATPSARISLSVCRSPGVQIARTSVEHMLDTEAFYLHLFTSPSSEAVPIIALLYRWETRARWICLVSWDSTADSEEGHCSAGELG